MNRPLRRFAPGWRMSLFVLIMLPILLSLGNWQLRRGAEKEALETDYLARSGALPIDAKSLASVDRDTLAFARLRLRGQYLPQQYYLIDNQVLDGTVGYWVLHRFESEDGRLWLVNRGFTKAAEQRAQLPAIATPTGPQTLVAIVWPDTGLVPEFGQSSAADQRPAAAGSVWPQRRQRLDARAMAAEHPRGQAVELRLEYGQPGVLQPAPSAFASGADRHRGYAVQWFGLAAVLMIGFVLFGLRRPQAES